MDRRPLARRRREASSRLIAVPGPVCSRSDRRRACSAVMCPRDNLGGKRKSLAVTFR